jgi:hypothetical protein
MAEKKSNKNLLKDAVAYATVTAIATSVTLYLIRTLIGSPISMAELLTIIVSVWLVGLAAFSYLGKKKMCLR